MRKLFALLAIVAATAAANEISVHTLQSGDPSGPTPIHDHGIHGEGQVIAVLDTGLDYDHCQFAEADGSPPPINTGNPRTGLASANVDTSRRKVIAYDFLYSCDQYPGFPGCEDPNLPTSFDNQGHGTVTASAAAGDSGAFVVHDLYDSIAPAAKLVIQDTGYIGGDACTQRAGLRCPIIDLHPVLQQAYDQGARIHSNSWGDLQGSLSNPPTANYSAAARDIDDFIWLHPDMVVVFNTGNAGLDPRTGQLLASSLSAPGDAKNTIQVGGTRVGTLNGVSPPDHLDDTLWDYSGTGPTRDGRVKPDVVGPAYVRSALPDKNVTTGNCDTSWQPGTSLASPTIAGAVALIRQYYADGFYPSGTARSADRFNPSAALVKATVIASARAVPYHGSSYSVSTAAPPPSYQQGWGFPVLGDVLAFSPSRLQIRDIASGAGLAQGESQSINVVARAGTPLKIALVWTDPAGVPHSSITDSTPELVNDLDLRVVDPSGAVILGNDSLHPGLPDRLNNVEVVSIASPVTGVYSVSITAATLGRGPRQGYALVMGGDFTSAQLRPKPHAVRH